MSGLRFFARNSSSVVAFEYGDDSYKEYCDKAHVQWTYGPEFPIGPGRTYRAPVVGNFYFCPIVGDFTNTYLLEFTPAQWSELLSEITWEGAISGDA